MKKSRFIIAASACVLGVIGFMSTKANKKFTGYKTAYIVNTAIAVQVTPEHFTTNSSFARAYIATGATPTKHTLVSQPNATGGLTYWH